MKKGVTLKDIAGKLRMSVSTVSKALSGDPLISAPTKERVQKLADEWAYVPNEAARHFKQNKSLTLGLIIPNLLDQFYGLAINGVEEVAAQKKYNVIVAQSHEDAAQEQRIVDLMMRNRVDGVIAAIAKNTTDLSPFKKLMATGIPVVFFSRSPGDASFNYVSADNEDGALKVVEFLLQRGHTRIAHLMGPASMPVSGMRLHGYKKALAKHGIAYDPELVKSVDFSTKSTRQAMAGLLKMASPPTGIFAFKDYISLDVIQYIRERHPERLDEIDVVGFGNLPLLQYVDCKPAASLEENAQAMGQAAARLLFSTMDGEESSLAPQRIKVPCKLVIYAKTGRGHAQPAFAGNP